MASITLTCSSSFIIRARRSSDWKNNDMNGVLEFTLTILMSLCRWLRRFRRRSVFRLSPQSTVKAAVLDCFGDIFGGDVGFGEVGDGGAWCGERNGRVPMSAFPAGSCPLILCILVVSRLHSSGSGRALHNYPQVPVKFWVQWAKN